MEILAAPVAEPKPATPTPYGVGTAAASASGPFATSFLQALFPPAPPVPPGPEPPPPPPAAKAVAEEAVETSNTNLQKLDSPQQDTKPKQTTDLPAPVSLQALMSQFSATPFVANLTQPPIPAPAAKDILDVKPAQTVTTSGLSLTKDDGESNSQPDLKLRSAGNSQDVFVLKPGRFTVADLPTDPKAPIVAVMKFDEPATQPQSASGRAADVDEKSVELTPAPEVLPQTTAAPVDQHLAQDQAAAKSSFEQRISDKVVEKSVAVAEAPAPKNSTDQKATAEEMDAAPVSITKNNSRQEGSFQQPSGQRQEQPATGFQPLQAIRPTTHQEIFKTAAPETINSLKGVNRVDLVKQVADHVQTAIAARPKDGLVVELSPKNLGSITVTVKSTKTTVDTHISATNETVREALSQSKPVLIQAIQEKGYNVTSLSFSSDSNSQQSAAQGQQRQDQPAQQPRTAQQFFKESTPEAPATLPSRFKRASGVDVWI